MGEDQWDRAGGSAPRTASDTSSDERIATLQAYDRGELGTAEALARLGIARTQFYRLVRSWRAYRDPASLPGRGRRGPKPKVTDAQRDAIRQAVEETSRDEALDVAIRLAIGRIAATGEVPPSAGTVRRIAADFRRPPSGERTGDPTIVVDAAAVDVAATDGVGAPFLPVVLFATTGVGAPPIEALALRERPGAAEVARLLGRLFEKAAIGRLDSATRSALAREEVRVRINRGDDAGWRSLAEALGGVGVILTGSIAKHPSGLLATQHFGHVVEGLGLLPRKTRLDSSARALRSDRRARSLPLIESWLVGEERAGSDDVLAGEHDVLSRRSQTAAAFVAGISNAAPQSAQ